MLDADLAKICASSYDPSTKWDRSWSGDIFAGLQGSVLCFRGSVTLEDWLRDLDAIPTIDPDLGGLHAGFARGLKDLFTENIQFFSERIIICGHSLGAARALIFAGHMAKAGIKPLHVAVFGCPRPGFLQLANALNQVSIHSYKNRMDPVTDVPLPLYPDLPYVHPRSAIEIDVKPEELDADPSPWLDFNVSGLLEGLTFEDHHIELYEKGCADA